MMGLQGMVAAAFNGATARLQRTVIAYAICVVAGVGALIMATGASVLALEPYVGEIYARLIVAAVFVLVVLSTILWLQGQAPASADRPGCRSRAAGASAAPGAICPARNDR